MGLMKFKYETLNQIKNLKKQQKIAAKLLCFLLLFNIIMMIALLITGICIAHNNENRVMDDMDDYLENQLEMEYLESLPEIEEIE